MRIEGYELQKMKNNTESKKGFPVNEKLKLTHKKTKKRMNN